MKNICYLCPIFLTKFLINIINMNRVIYLLLSALMLAITPLTAQQQTVQKQQALKKQPTSTSQQATSQRLSRVEAEQTGAGIKKLADPIYYTELFDEPVPNIPLGGSGYSGSVDDDEIIIMPWNQANGVALSFDAKAGHVYKIALTFEAKDGVFDDFTGAYLLKSGELSGGSDDFLTEIERYFRYNQVNNILITGAFLARETAPVRMLLFDYSMNSFDFNVTIQELGTAPSYIEIDYEPIEADGSEVEDSCSDDDLVIFGDDVLAGKGFIFPTQANRHYKITCDFTPSDLDSQYSPTLRIFTGGEFQNNHEDCLDEYNYWAADGPVTITLETVSFNTGYLRIFVGENHLNDVDFTLAVEDLGAVSTYMQVDYTAVIPTDGTPVSGSFNAEEDLFHWIWGNEVTGKGYRFQAEADRMYEIECEVTGTPGEEIDGAFWILNNPLTGDESDILTSGWYYNWNGSATANGHFISEVSGYVYFLLMDRYQSDISYTITVKDVGPAPPEYTELAYPTIATNGVSVEGELEMIQIWYQDLFIGKGYSFDVKADKIYRITCVLTAEVEDELNGSIWIMNNTLTGYWDDDVLYSDNHWGYGTVAVSGFYTPDFSGTVKLLFGESYLLASTYKITVTEMDVPESYHEIDYTLIATDGNAVAGAFDKAFYGVDNDEYTRFGSAYKFTAQEGKPYVIDCTFEGVGYLYPSVQLFGSLSGDWFDDSIDWTYYNYGDEIVTVSFVFTPDYDGEYYLVMFSVKDLNFTIAVKEMEPTVNYTELEYTAMAGNAATGILDKFFEDFDLRIGTGYSYSVSEGSMYKITATLEAPAGYLNASLQVFNQSWDVKESQNGDTKGSVTLTGYYFAETGENIRILLSTEGFFTPRILGYNIEIEETALISYTEIVYESIDIGSSANGMLSMTDNLLVNPENKVATGRGYKFIGEAEKVYKIKVTFISSEEILFNTGFYLLDNDFDNMDYVYEYDFLSELSISAVYTASENGEALILLNDYFRNDLLYTVEVKEILSLPQLLARATPITMSNQLRYTDSGFTYSEVAGNEALNFKGNNEIFFSAAYTITLAANDQIEIYSSKENDSHLFIFRSNGSGGYVYVTNDDDGGYLNGRDSYINFTAPVSGDYFIVVTDYNNESAGRYYLTVWNYGLQPENGYLDNEVIASVSLSSTAVTVYVDANDNDILTALMSLEVTGITADEEEVTLPNVPAIWDIAGDKNSAICRVDNMQPPLGYEWGNIQQVTVAVNYIKYEGETVATPELDGKTENSITIKAVAAPANGQSVVYFISTSATVPSESANGWQAGLTFSNLTANTAYYVFARTVENAMYLAGAVSTPLQVTTDEDVSSSSGEGLIANPLRAWMRDGLLHVTGLTIGETISIYSVTGVLAYQSNIASEEMDIQLPAVGVYIVRSGNNTVRVVFIK